MLQELCVCVCVCGGGGGGGGGGVLIMTGLKPTALDTLRLCFCFCCTSKLHIRPRNYRLIG